MLQYQKRFVLLPNDLKAISGSVDAAYRVFADPLLLAGKVKKLNGS